MLATTVVNIKSGAAYDVYIGRANPTYGLPASKWGNPFKLTREADRAIVLSRYRIWLLSQRELLAALPELRGKVLACWCKPELCHGDVLAELAETRYGDPPPAQSVLVECPNCGAHQLLGRACECEGRPIDWAARKARAMAYQQAKHGINNPPYDDAELRAAGWPKGDLS